MADLGLTGKKPNSTRCSDLVISLSVFDSPAAIEVALSSLIANNWIEVSAGLLHRAATSRSSRPTRVR